MWCETTRNQWICHFIMTLCHGWLSSYCCRWWGRGEACCSATMVSMTTPCWGSLRVTNCPRISTSDKMEPELIILLQVKKGIDAFQSARFKWIWNIWTLKIRRLFKSLCFEKFVHNDLFKKHYFGEIFSFKTKIFNLNLFNFIKLTDNIVSYFC